MKAKVKETGKIFDVYGVVNKTCDGYGLGEVELMVDDKDSFNYDMTPAYWERLRHEYAGMAMQGIVMNEKMQEDLYKAFGKNESMDVTISDSAIVIATTLIQKLKEKEERK